MEDLLLNITGIGYKMKVRPKGGNLYRFFKGEYDAISPEQIADVDEILSAEFKRVKEHIRLAKKSHPVGVA